MDCRRRGLDDEEQQDIQIQIQLITQKSEKSEKGRAGAYGNCHQLVLHVLSNNSNL